MAALTRTVIYLLVALIEIMQPSSPMTVDYLQNDTPAMVIRIVPVENSDNDVFLITASAAPLLEAGETISVRIEQTDLYAHNYLAFVAGAPPVLLDLGPMRRALVGVDLKPADGRQIDLMFDLAASSESAVGGVPVVAEASLTPLGGPLYLLGRPPYLILTAPAEAVVLISR